MSVIVQEIAGSKRISKPMSGFRSAERSFVVYDDEGIIPTIDDMLMADGMPLIGQVHPDSVTLFAGGYDFSLNADRANTWEVTWKYSPTQLNPSEEEEEDQDVPTTEEVTVTGFNIVIGQTVLDIWKANPTIPSNVDNPSNTTDIGGTEVHEMGYPISFALPTAEITITKKVFESNFNGAGFIGNVTKRNEDDWIGFPAGSVLFKGVSVSRDNFGVFSFSFKLAYDKWFHLRQKPQRAEDGNPEVISTATPKLNVYFVQPFEETVSFVFLPNV